MMSIDKIKNIYKGEVNTLAHSDNAKKLEMKKHEHNKISNEKINETDRIDISAKGMVVSKISGALKHHVPVNSTVYVDTGTIMKIMDFSTHNEKYQWSEMGKDEEKRWVVINGQRFEAPLSEEEKRLMRNAGKTMLDYIKESEDERAERDAKRGIKTNVTLGADGNLKLDTDVCDKNLSNFMNNDVVQDMLKEMMGKGLLTNLSISI